MNKTKIICSLLVLIFTILPLVARADGVVIRPLPKGDWTWAEEGSQQAFINYENGLEKLIVAVDIEQGNSDAVWIIPVPGSPEQVGIDVVSELPIFFGSEVISKAKIAFYQKEVFEYLASSQIWTLPFMIVGVSLRGAGVSLGSGAAGDLVSVEKHIEKEGMIVETITAKTGEALYNYLAAKGLKIEQGSITVLESYIEKDYVFVVSWINPAIDQQEKETRKGIFITFPTPKIYYPLIPTSAYGQKEIPITIRVLGYVKPKLFSEIKPYTGVEYFTNRPSWESSGARRARCMSDVNEIRTQLELYYFDHNRYPSSLEELRQDPNFSDKAEMLIEDITKFCAGIFNYSGGHDSYQVYAGIGKDEVFFIDSEGHAEKRSTPEDMQFSFSEIETFYKGSENVGVWKGEGDYTKITINAPAKLLKQDLWMKQGKPLKISLALSVINFSDNYPMVFNIFLYLIFGIILSWLAGGITGLIYFRDFKKYALIGVANIATLFGFIVVLRLLSERWGLIPSPKRGFTLVFSMIFLGLTALVWFWMKFLVG